MHELTLTQNILSIVLEKAREAKAGKVTRVNLAIGELSGVVDECVRFYFDFLSRNTIAAQADLTFRHHKVELRCQNCSFTFSPRKNDWSCPNCHRQQAEVISGRECYIDSIEVE